MAKPDLNTSEGPVEISPWYSFLAGLSSWTGISQNRLWSTGLVVSALAAFLAGEGFDAIGWDSAGLLLRVSMVVAGVASIVVLLPSVGRRIVVSLLILFHFGGILSAVTCVNPAPWVSVQLWTYVFRPYVHFLYFNNAYHFYSPEPGPAYLMWFCIEYEKDPDGTRNFRWVFEPDLDPNGHAYDPDGSRVWSGTEYTRRLSLGENCGLPNPPPLNLLELLNRRLYEGERQDFVALPPGEMPYINQYREPNNVSKRWIRSFVRHVAHTYKHEEKLQLKVTGVKFYRVTHAFLSPGRLVAGIEPNDPETYLPYYFGEYDANGKMKESCQKFDVDEKNKTIQETYRDPFLYWLIQVKDVRRHAEGRDGMIPWGIPSLGDVE